MLPLLVKPKLQRWHYSGGAMALSSALDTPGFFVPRQHWIYPLLHPHQLVMQLPGLFGWNETQCPEEQQVSALLAKLDGYWAWAQADDRVIGMAPWHMNDRSANFPNKNLGKGAVNSPAVMAKLREINAQIPCIAISDE
jgi:hypothetical protein